MAIRYLFLLATCFALLRSTLVYGQAELAKQKYNAGNYAEAYEAVKDSSVQQLEHQYYRGIAALALMKDDNSKTDYPDIGKKAMASLITAYGLDNEEQYQEAIQEDLHYLSIQFLDWGIKSYNRGMRDHDSYAVQTAIDYLSALINAYPLLGAYESSMNVHMRDNYYTDINHIRFSLANAHYRLKHYDLAKMKYEELMDMRYEEAMVYINLAKIYRKNGKDKQADEMLERMSNKMADLPAVSLAYAEVLASRKNYEDALKIVRKAKRRTRKADPYITEAKIYMMQKNFEFAKQALTFAQEADDDDFRINKTFGDIYVEMANEQLALWKKSGGTDKTSSNYVASENNLKLALRQYKSSNRQNPASEEVIQSIIDTYEAMGQGELAEEYRDKLK